MTIERIYPQIASLQVACRPLHPAWGELFPPNPLKNGEVRFAKDRQVFLSRGDAICGVMGKRVQTLVSEFFGVFNLRRQVLWLLQATLVAG